MKTVKEYNDEYLQRRRDEQNKTIYQTNISCPICVDVELLFYDPNMILCSCPPQKVVYCPTCGHKDYIYV